MHGPLTGAYIVDLLVFRNKQVIILKPLLQSVKYLLKRYPTKHVSTAGRSLELTSFAKLEERRRSVLRLKKHKKGTCADSSHEMEAATVTK
jgi:hypothetical protein